MIVVYSNIPKFLLKNLAKRFSIKNWIYLGKKYEVENKFQQQFQNHAKEIRYARELHRITHEHQKPFIQWINQISKNQPLKEEWMYSTPAVKNTYSSDLFLTVCYFQIFKKYLEGGKAVDCVVVDSPALGRIIKTHFSADTVYSFTKIGYALKGWIKNILRYFKFVIKTLRIRTACKTVLKRRWKSRLKDKKDIVLIRNYITGECKDSDDDLFERHFFPGLNEFLSSKEYTPVYVPVATKVSDYVQLCCTIKEHPKLIFLPEEFLTFSDHVYCYLSPIRALNYQFDIPLYNSDDLSALVKEEYLFNITESGLLYASLLSRLGKKLFKNNIKPEAIINWFENQSFEKGLLRGLKNEFPDMKIIASQPFLISPNLLSFFPSDQEKMLGILPDKMLVLGPIERRYMHEKYADLRVEYTPAFRYTKTIHQLNVDSSKARSLLVLMGYNFANAQHVIRILIQAHKNLKDFDKVILKLHPASFFSKDQLVNKVRLDLPKNFSFVDGNLEEYIESTAVGICGATGCSVELVIHGIPTIIIGEERALTYNYLAFREDPGIWRMCFDDREIIDTANEFLYKFVHQRDEYNKIAEDFRRDFFAENHDQYWENYSLNETLPESTEKIYAKKEVVRTD